MRLVRVDDRAVAVVAAVGGVAAAWSDASPVGSRAIDVVLLFLAAGVVTWASASASGWAGASVAGIGALLAIDPLVTAIGAVGCIGGLWLGSQRRDLSVARAAVGGVAVNVLCRMEFGLFVGASALVGGGLGATLVVVGLLRRHSIVRRWATRVGLAVAGLAVLAGIGVGVAGLSARSDVYAGRRMVAEGIDLLRDGEYEDAAVSFDRAATTFRSAETTIGRPWAQPGRLLPIAAQNREAVAVLSTRAAAASADLANAALFIDPSDLKVSSGRFDLAALAEIEGPLTAAYDSMVELRRAIDAVDSPWLVDQVESPMESAAAEFDDNIHQIETAVQALQTAPGLLGGDGIRNYFVAFTTPAEARGTGGFMGNYAVLTADDGALSVSEFGRAADLNAGGTGERRIDPPDDWAALWGRFGLTSGPGATTGDVPWSNVTLSPHFPSTAKVIADLFPQSGGIPVDGVLAMDPFVLQALVGFTGPVSVDVGVVNGDVADVRLTEQNTAQFLLFDQYTIEDAATRTDMLEQVAELVIDELLDGALPGPTVLADQLKPLVDEGRLVGWMSDPDEQSLFERIGVAGGLADREGGDGFQVVVNNAGANKLDAYLGRSVRYRAEFDAASRVVVGRLDVTFTNDGPTSGLPDGVIGNYVGDPIGTNRLLVTVYTALPVTGASIDGEQARFEAATEAGWSASRLYLVLPPGTSQTVSFSVAGQLPPGDPADPSVADTYRLVVGTQPLVLAADNDIRVTDVHGDVVLERTGKLPGIERLAAASTAAPAAPK